MLMKLFIENPNKAFTRDELLNLIWGYDFFWRFKDNRCKYKKIKS